MDKLYPISLVNLVIDGIHYGHERNLIINIIYPKDHISTSVDTLKFAFDIAKKYLNTNEQVPTEYRTDIKISYTPLNGEVWNSEEKYVIDLRSVDIIDTDDIEKKINEALNRRYNPPKNEYLPYTSKKPFWFEGQKK